MKVAIVETQHAKNTDWSVIAICVDKKVADEYIAIQKATTTDHDWRFRMTDIITNITIKYGSANTITEEKK